MWNVTRISYGESWKARMQGGSVEEGLCGDFVAMAYFRQQRGDVVHLVSKDSKDVLIKATNDKDCSLMFGVFRLMTCVSKDSGDELEYLRELFLDSWLDDHLVASLTLDSAGSYVMQGALFTQGMIPSISIGGSISPEGFLLPVLLLVVIIVMVVFVIVILIVVVDDVSLILKLSFVIIGFLHRITLYYLIH
ncbi:hypothetical protein Tco_1153618 [Tanacetum coccineum]